MAFDGRPQYIATSAIAFISTLLHMAGISLLLSLSKSRMSNTQRCYLLHLSLSQLLLSAGVSVWILIEPRSRLEHVIVFVLDAILFSSLLLMWYLIMITLVIDRFLAVYWTIKYPIYWSARNANALCIVQWIICLALGSVGITLRYATRINILGDKFMYVMPLVLDWIFVLAVFVVYTYMYIKYRQSVRSRLLWRQCHATADCGSAEGVLSSFRGYKFWVPTLMVTSFMLLVVIPDQISAEYTLSSRKAHYKNGTFMSIVYILYSTGWACNAFIYILLSPPLKNLLLTKINAMKIRMKFQKLTSTSQTSVGTPTTIEMQQKSRDDNPIQVISLKM